ncbi:nucleoside 2-deoxyribosyltransferase, partial [Acidovorax sp. ST3]|uniref:nucleoside 2-deoxyribosyltransferase n=1 Tax=Acidovorax sp. ST3 TaxID=2219062 RepID=UPI00193E0DF4
AMRRITSIYLAGPDASFPDAAALAAEKRALCETAGFVPVLSGDGFLVETEPSEAMAREIYADRVSRMRLTDAGIVNLTPFRGPSCDAGAAFEAGFLAALAPKAWAATLEADAVFATAYMKRDGSYGAAVLSEAGKMLHAVDLPDRGHDVTFDPVSGRSAVFARQPGTFFV